MSAFIQSEDGFWRRRWNQPEVLCAVLLREPLWLEARMDDQALFEGSVVLSDEDGPEESRKINK